MDGSEAELAATIRTFATPVGDFDYLAFVADVTTILGTAVPDAVVVMGKPSNEWPQVGSIAAS